MYVLRLGKKFFSTIFYFLLDRVKGVFLACQITKFKQLMKFFRKRHSGIFFQLKKFTM